MSNRNDPSAARVFTPEETKAIAAGDAGSPTMLRMPLDMARVIAENMQAFATYHDAVAARCSTEHGKDAMTQSALALRSYAAGLMEHAT